MNNLDPVKARPRSQQVLNLLVQGCSNKEIGVQLNMSASTVKQHLRLWFLRAGILDGRKRVKLARYVRDGENTVVASCEGLNPKQIQVSALACEGLSNREIGEVVGVGEQSIKNCLRSVFDKLGVWSRLELAMYVVNCETDLLPETEPLIPSTITSATKNPLTATATVPFLKEKIALLRAEIAELQELNCLYRREGIHGTLAKVANVERHERLLAIQRELTQLGGRRIRLLEPSKEWHRSQLPPENKAS